MIGNKESLIGSLLNGGSVYRLKCKAMLAIFVIDMT